MKTLITGSNTGLGKALVERFSLEGKVIVGEFYDSIKKISDAAISEDVDVFISGTVIACPKVEIEKVDDDLKKKLLDLGLLIPIQLTQNILPYFKERKRGAIIYINSFVGIEPKRNLSIYSATRGGLRWFTESLRFEARDNNVLIMGVYPTQIIENYKDIDVGLHAKDVAEYIFNGYKKGTERLIIDNRPEQIRIQELKKHTDIKDDMLTPQQYKGNEEIFWSGKYWSRLSDEDKRRDFELNHRGI